MDILLHHTHIALHRLFLWQQVNAFSATLTPETSSVVVETLIQNLPLLSSSDHHSVFQSLHENMGVCTAIRAAIQSEYQQTITHLFHHLCTRKCVDEFILRSVALSPSDHA